MARMDEKNKDRKPVAGTKKRQQEDEKNLASLKNLYFNRYLMIRYALALFFFSNFYWLIFVQKSVIAAVPLSMLIFSILPCYENFKCYGQPEPCMRWTRIFFMCQCVVNMFVLASVFTPIFKTVLPMLTDTTISRVIILFVALSGWLIDLACLKRFREIMNHEDAQFKRIIEFEQTVQVHL